MNTNIKNKFFSSFVLLVLTLSLLFPSSVALADETAPPPEETQEPSPPAEEAEEPVSVTEETQEPVPPQEIPQLEVFPIETLTGGNPPELQVFPTETPAADATPDLQVFPLEDFVDNGDEPAVPAEEDVSLVEIVTEAAALNITLADDRGEPLDLTTVDTSEMLASGDPYFTRNGITFRFYQNAGDCALNGYEVDLENTCFEASNAIQAAIDNVATYGAPDLLINDLSEGIERRTIFVEAGTYEDQVVIADLPNLVGITLWGNPGILTLPGAGPNAAILDGSNLTGTTTGITINAYGVSIIGFVIQNYDIGIYHDVLSGNSPTYITNNDILNNGVGIQMVGGQGKPGTEVHYNIFDDNNTALANTDDNNVQWVYAQENYWGCPEGPVIKYDKYRGQSYLGTFYRVWTSPNTGGPNGDGEYTTNPYPGCELLGGYNSLWDFQKETDYSPFKIKIGNQALPGCEDPEANNYSQVGECTYDPVPYCGDGVVNQTSEECDGTAPEHYSCTNECTLEYVPYCGDGSVDPGEECDGSAPEHYSCTSGCTLEYIPYCGDGIQDVGEACDDGNNVDGDGCSASCTVEPPAPYCGDGIQDVGEACDDGNNVDGDGCSASCTVEPPAPYCGDGNLDEGEACDDGNLTVNDGCSAICTIEVPVCGNGYVEQGEACDDDNTINGDGCSATCSVEIPGCTDPQASNYDPNAAYDDGSCTYQIFGCTDPFALNYDSGAIFTDGSCRYPLTPPEPTLLLDTIIPVTGGETHAIAAGIAHTCALTPIGGVQCWGNNAYGQLGDGTNTASSLRVDVLGLNSGTTIVAGGNHTCVLAETDAWCWGQNSSGQVGDETTTDRNIPVKVLSGAVDITAGFDYTCATLSNGQVMCWGNNDNGQIAEGGQATYPSPTLSKLVSGLLQVDAGRNKNCGLTSTGLIRCVNEGVSKELGTGSSTNLNVAVNRFDSTVIALNDQGVPIQFLFGEPKVVSQLRGVQDIDSGYGHVCALENTGAVKCWGANNYGQLGNNSKNRSSEPVSVSGLPGAWQLAVGMNHTCVITTTGSQIDQEILCWGLNTDGQLGDGSNETSFVPVKVK